MSIRLKPIWLLTLVLIGVTLAPLSVQAAFPWNNLGGYLGRLFGGSTNGTVSGQVKVNGGGTNNQVTVTVGGLNQTVSSTGYYQQVLPVTGLSRNITVQFAYKGSPAQTQSYPVTLYPNSTVRRDHNFIVGHTGTVSGQVTSRDAKPVKDSAVVVDGKTVKTDSEGRYRQVVSWAGPTNKEIGINFACTGTTYFRNVEKDKTTTVDFNLCPNTGGDGSSLLTGSVQGTVKVNNAPANNAKVIVTGVNPGGWFTGSNGQYSSGNLTNLPAAANVTISYLTYSVTLPDRPFHAGVNIIDYSFTGTAPAPNPTPAPTPTPTPTPAQGKISGTIKVGGQVVNKNTLTVTLTGGTQAPFNGSKSYPVNDLGYFETELFPLSNDPAVLKPTFAKLTYAYQQAGKAVQTKDFTQVYVASANKVMNWDFPAPSDRNTLSGSVILADSRIPLAGLDVVLDNKHGLYRTVQTDNDGNYKFSDIPASALGAVTVTARESNDGKGLWQELSTNLAAGDNHLDFVMRADANVIFGEIALNYNQPNEQLVVRVQDNNNQEVLVIMPNTVYINDDISLKALGYNSGKCYGAGCYLEKGTYQVSVWTGTGDQARQVAPNQTVIFTRDYGDKQEVNFEIASRPPVVTPRMEILVLEDTGERVDGQRPLAGAQITVTNKNNGGTEILFQTTTGSDGKATVTDLKGLRLLTGLSITATKDGYEYRGVTGGPITLFPLSRDLNFSQSQYVLVLQRQALHNSICENNPTADLPEFWFCGSEAKALYPTKTDVWQTIDKRIAQLRDLFPRFKDTPPEVQIVSSAERQAYASITFKKSGNGKCFPDPDRSVVGDDSGIYYTTRVVTGESLAQIIETTTHEWGHLKDFKEGNCLGFGSNKSAIGGYQRNHTRSNGFNFNYFEPITEKTYSPNGGGHPYDNPTETYASVFTVAQHYLGQFNDRIKNVLPEWQKEYKEMMTIVNKP